MNIALCTDDNYVAPCLVTIISLLENNKDEDCVIYVLTEGLSKSNIEQFNYLSIKYNNEVSIKKISTDCFSSLNVTDRFPKSVYFRFLLPELLPDSKKALYLDCDVMVRNSLAELYSTDISEYACAAVEDQRGDDVSVHNHIFMYSKYFNSGVLLMNLEYWRKNNISENLKNYIKAYPERCWFPDQDALNVVLENKVLFLDYKYNVQGEMLGNRFYFKLSALKWAEVDRATKNPYIVHFTDIDKPWYKECKHPFKEEYIKYARLCPISFRLVRRDGIGLRFWDWVMRLSRYMHKRYKREFNRPSLFE